jgi:hypothetical protein
MVLRFVFWQMVLIVGLGGLQARGICVIVSSLRRRRDRVAEGAPLLREYVPKVHRGFESLRLRQI